MFFDLTLAQQTYQNFLDVGLVEGTNSLQTTWPSMVQYNPSNFFIGVTNFSFVVGSNQPQIGIQIGPDFNLSSSSGYSAVRYQYLNLRVLGCASPNIYYRSLDQMCYATCPSYTYLNTTNNYCYECYYACYSCTNTGSTSCTGCNITTSHRDLATGQCKCISGYYETGVSICGSCSYTCLTCNGSTTSSCLTCPSTRTLNGSKGCPCNAGLVDVGVATC